MFTGNIMRKSLDFDSFPWVLPENGAPLVGSSSTLTLAMRELLFVWHLMG
jgi:hypothetical protein